MAILPWKRLRKISTRWPSFGEFRDEKNIVGGGGEAAYESKGPDANLVSTRYGGSVFQINSLLYNRRMRLVICLKDNKSQHISIVRDGFCNATSSVRDPRYIISLPATRYMSKYLWTMRA